MPVLLGLLLAAVMKVRMAALRSQCSNNLRQIALAAHMHHDAYEALPPSVRMSATHDGMAKLSWLARLLPFLEQQPVWQETLADYQRTPDPFDFDHPHRNTGRVLAIFGCPVDSRVSKVWMLWPSRPNMHFAMNSYLGNHGTNYLRRDGVLYKDSATRLTHITDGSSSTLLAGERPPSADLRYGWWYAGEGMARSGAIDFTLGARERRVENTWPGYDSCQLGPFQYQQGTLEDFCSAYHYWSLHPGGSHFAFCDGSVRFLNYSVDEVLPAVSTRNAGEVVAVP